MKLYFVVDYNRSDGKVMEDSAASPSSHASRSKMMHPHEDYSTYSNMIKYKIFRDCYRSNYKTYEYPLIDVPDELMFQFMMMGLQDYDFIVYNHRTKKIVVGNQYYDSCVLAASDDDEEDLRNGHYGYTTSADGDGYAIDFSLPSPDEVEREDITIRVDSETGYDDILEVLKPFAYNFFYVETSNLLEFLDDFPAIGRSTQARSEHYSYPVAYDVIGGDTGQPIRLLNRMLVPGESLIFIFRAYYEDDEFWLNTKKRYTPRQVELLRTYMVDILAKFQEHTGTKWDV